MKTMTIQVVAAIIWRDGELLITRRPVNTHLGGMWEFPGGKVEPGESLIDALVREIREELGIAVAVRDELLNVTHCYPERNVELHFFNCSIIDGIPSALSADELRWVKPAELGAFEFPPADCELIARIQGR